MELNWLYILCFALGALITTATVRLSGLFITITSQPLLFALFTPLTAWLLSKENLSGGSDPLSKTMLLSAAYPLAVHFPALAAITVATIVIGVWRWRRAKVRYETELAMLERRRRREAHVDRNNRETATRVRQMSRPRRNEPAGSQRVPFSELIKDVNSRADNRRAQRGSARSAQRSPLPRQAPKSDRMPPRSATRVERRHEAEKPTARRGESPRQRSARRSLSDDLYS